MRYIRLSFIILFSGILISTGRGQSPEISWIKVLGGRYADAGNSVCQAPDGGYIVAGFTYASATRGYDVYLIKTSSGGSLVWDKTCGGQSDDWANCVQNTSDGGFIIAGGTESFGDIYGNVYLIKTDSTGNVEWEKNYGGRYGEEALWVEQTGDGGYILAGWTNSFGYGGDDFYVIRTDSDGDTLWTRTCGENFYDKGYCVKETSDGCFIVAGGIGFWGTTPSDGYLIKINPDGDLLWARRVGGNWAESVRGVAIAPDGGFQLTGWTMSFGNGQHDVYIAGTDSLGQNVISKTCGGVSTDVGTSISPALDGGYIITGYTSSYGAGNYDIYMIKTDSQGDTLWTKVHGGINADQGLSAIQCDDGGYVITGLTQSFGSAGSNVILIKLASDQGTDIGDRIDFLTPVDFLLHQNYPNPFNAATTISFTLETQQSIKLKIYDIMGREVCTLADGLKDAGYHRVLFDGSDLACGVYIYRIETDDYCESRRMILIK
jgi:hypothetical protein